MSVLRVHIIPTLLAVSMLLGMIVPFAPAGATEEATEPAYHYRIDEIPPVTYANISGWSVLPAEVAATTIDVPAYPFYGQEGLTQVTLTSDGALLPQGTTWSDHCYGRPVPMEDCQDGLIAGLWTNLDHARCGEIRYTVTDTELKVSFAQVAYANERRCEGPLHEHDALIPLVFPKQTVTFGMSLSFADGSVEVHLIDVDGKYLASTGIESTNGTFGTQARLTADELLGSSAFRFTRHAGLPPEDDPGEDPDEDPDDNQTAGSSHYRVATIPATALDTSAWNEVSLGDDQTVALTIPTTPFWNRNISQMHVSSNGFVSLGGGSDPGCCSPNPIPSDDWVNGIVAALWADLNPSQCGRIATHINTTFIGIAFEDVPYYGQSCGTSGGPITPPTPPGNMVSFWIGIQPDNGTIQVHLLRVDGGTTAATGIESHDGNYGNETRRTGDALAEPVAWEFTRHGGVPTNETDPEDPGDEIPTRPAPDQGMDSDHHAVVAFMDTGINPYHITYRDTSSQAYAHPSTYIPGYPTDALPLEITLDAVNWYEVVAHDCERVWSTVVPNQLYYFPGTKIVGAIFFHGPGGADCNDGDAWVRGILDTYGHGTMVSSRGASFEYGACTECKIVAVQSPLEVSIGSDPGTDGYENLWIAENAHWIDAQSNSWGPFLPVPLTDAAPQQYVGATPELARSVETASQAHLAFWASGNGALFRFGYLGHPTVAAVHMTPSAIIVGGYDSGYINTWPGFSPHLASDSCASWAAASHHTDHSADYIGGGTSGATPYAAGHAARVLLEARKMLGDGETGVDDGIVARGDPGNITSGPLADGVLTLAEWKDLVFKTADPRPAREENDGATCGTGGAFGHTGQRWDTIPEGYPEFLHIGYGGTTMTAFSTATAVLEGSAPMPDRTVTDAYFALDHAVRSVTYAGYSNVP